MKPSEIQKYLCDIIRSQVNFWKYSSDITSTTHIPDIEYSCLSLEDEDIIDSKKKGCFRRYIKRIVLVY